MTTPPPSFSPWTSFEANVSTEKARLKKEMLASSSYRMKRVGIRTARVLCGFVLLFVALVIFDNKSDIADIPMARLTIGMVAGNIASWIFGFLFLWWAWKSTFGPSPKGSELDDMLHAQASTSVSAWVAASRMNT